MARLVAGPVTTELLHGHPQTQAIRQRIAATLAEWWTLALADPRGYGDSGKPQSTADHDVCEICEVCRAGGVVDRGFRPLAEVDD